MDDRDKMGAAALAETARLRETTERLKALLRAAFAADEAAGLGLAPVKVRAAAGRPPRES